MLVGTVYLFKTMPAGFIPSQDSEFFFGGTLSEGISFESMEQHQKAVADVVKSDPDVEVVGRVRAG